MEPVVSKVAPSALVPPSATAAHSTDGVEALQITALDLPLLHPTRPPPAAFLLTAPAVFREELRAPDLASETAARSTGGAEILLLIAAPE